MEPLHPILIEMMMRLKQRELEKEIEKRRLVRLALGDRPGWWAVQSARLRCRWQNLRFAAGLGTARCVQAAA